MIFRSLYLGLFLLISPSSLIAQNKVIVPGGVWPDDKGNHVQAHGGGIIKIKDTYFWYGEERRQGLDKGFRYVSCYSSKDLMNWKFRGNVVKMADPENLGQGWVLERPKVFYNKKTKKYVMYFHLDDQKYKLARVGIAVSDKADGQFKYVKSFRPLGEQSRDIGQFIDDDGTPYLIFEDRPNGFHIVSLTDDYMNVGKEMTLVKAFMEGGAIVNYGGMYYSIGSHLTGWDPNSNEYSTAPTLSGPWAQFKNIAPVDKKTYGAQSTMLLKVVGTKKTTVIFMGDQWKPSSQWDSRYLWMPLEIGDGKLLLPEPRPWTINVKTGEWKYVDALPKP